MTALNTWTRLEPRSYDVHLERGLRHELRDPAWLVGRQLQVGELDGFDGGTAVTADPRGRLSRFDRIRAPGDEGWQAYDPDSTPLEPVLEAHLPPGPVGAVQAAEAGREFERILSAQGAPAELVDRCRARLPLGGSTWPPRPPAPEELLARVRRVLAHDDGRERLHRDVAEAREDRELLERLIEAVLGGDHARALDLLQAGIEGPLERTTRRWSPPHGGPREDHLADDALPAHLRELLHGSVIDGAALAGLVRGDGDPVTVLDDELSGRQRAVVVRAVVAFEAWLEQVHPSAGLTGTWDGAELAYGADLATAEGDRCTVRGHRGGSLEWPAWELIGSGNVGDDPVLEDGDLQPSSIGFTGLRPERWWELADERLDMDALHSDPEDLAALLLREFVLRAADRWMAAVLPVPLGSVCLLSEVRVTDTFGHVTSLRPRDGWSLFRPAPASDDGLSVLIVPPTAVDPLGAEADQRIHLLLDHASHLGWAAEEVVPDHTGAPHHRSGLRADDDEPKDAEDRSYQLRTEVPPAWFPLVPGDGDPSGDPDRLTLQQLGGDDEPVGPRGGLLEAGLTVPRDRVPDAGRRLESRWRLARWSDGSLHVWPARRVRDGSPLAPPSLIFDHVHPL